jgi:hypothetical protein
MHKNNAFVVVSWLPFICQSEPGCKSSKIGFDDMAVELQENCGGKKSTYGFFSKFQDWRQVLNILYSALQLKEDLAASVKKLLSLCNDNFWCKGRILVQAEHQKVFVVDGKCCQPEVSSLEDSKSSIVTIGLVV